MGEMIKALTDIVDRYREVQGRERKSDYDKGYLAGLGDAAEIAARALHLDLHEVEDEGPVDVEALFPS
jgi:hypothetical protein